MGQIHRPRLSEQNQLQNRYLLPLRRSRPHAGDPLKSRNAQNGRVPKEILWARYLLQKLFTERHGMNEPRVREELDVELTKGLLTVVNAKIDENLFGRLFSLEMPG